MTKALSLRQPWAELILQGKKTIETRTWNTKFRGEFLIHAAKQVNREACKQFNLDPDALTTGALVGKATVVDVKVYTSSEEFIADDKFHCAAGLKFRKYGFLLKDVKRIKPIPCKGQLGFFEIHTPKPS